ncbi:gliding motility-associated C-terminal domain-containing protein [Maribacter sp.]|uniref:T9SS type B sorting domain-containing protein n=1 Tax=Maribacter sp. TaxID=1897614 RepID=UPI0025B9CCAC|nr:gliding motility-associated C-terminal domain-containing protein [Maribacter sp.]
MNKKIFFKNEVYVKGYLCLPLFVILLFSGFVGQSQTVSISSLDDTAAEVVFPGVNTASFTVSRTGSTFSSLNVTINVGGTADGGTDYTTLSLTVNIPLFQPSTTVLLSGIVDDALVEGDETVVVTIEPGAYIIGAAASTTLTIADNDVAGVNIDTLIGTTTEAGGTTDFLFTLTSEPTANVTIPISGYDATETSGPASVTLTSLNWNTGVTLTIAGIDDSIVDGDIDDIIITGNTTSLDSDYSGFTVADLTVTNTDDDVVGVNIDTLIGTATEAGGTTDFLFTLTSEPAANVTIPISGYDATETSGPASVTLTPLNWNTGVTLTIAGIDDSIVDGNIDDIIITGNTTSLGSDYSGLAVADLTVTNTDDDTAGLTVSSVTGNTTEAGGIATFTVTLDSEPTTAVTITLSSNDTTEGAVSPAVVIPTANWNIPTVVTVVGVDDAIVDDFQNYSISGVVTSSGPDYAGIVMADVAVTNTDDDEAGVNINTLTGTTTEAGDVQAIFVFTLTSMPSASVTININGYVPTENSGPTSITIEPGEWNTGATLTILGVDDTSIDGNHVGTINTGNVISADSFYNALTDADVPQLTVTNNDDDGCGSTPVSNGLSAEFCGEISANLNNYTNTPPPSGMTLIWSRSSNPFNVVGRLDPQSLSENITSEGSFFGYFYDATNDCAGGVLEIELISNEIPAIESGTGAINCGPGILLLSATASAGASLKWFSSLTGGTELATGNSYSTVNLDKTTSFYVEAEANGCVSRERVEVVATIIPEAFSGTASNDIACSLASTQQPLSAIDLDSRLLGSPDIGVWSFVSGPATLVIEADNVVSFVDQAVGDYIFRYTTTEAVAPCANTFTDVTISVTADCTPDPIDLEILKTVNNPNAIAGENVIFTITVNNLSPNKVQNIVVGDLLESGFDYVSNIPSSGTYDEVTGIWQISELGAMGTATLNIEVTVLPEGIYTNVAELLESFPLDNNTANDRAEVSLIIDVPEGVDLKITKTANSNRPLIRDAVVFTIKVENKSVETIVSQIRVSDLISVDSGFVYVSHNTLNGDYDAATGVWLISELAKDEEATLEITVTVPSAGTFINTATIIGSVPAQTDSNDADNNNTASAEVLVSLPTEADCGFVFNQFSPNGDGTNDFLKIQCIEQYPANRLQIYDRYGNLVYTVAGYINNWDGEGDSGQVPDGTYFYLLDLGNDTEVLKGWIQLIR